jgi:hypothetical protein
LLVVHHHNESGQKAQVVSLSSETVASDVTLELNKTSVAAGGSVTGTVTVANTENSVPTGNVVLKTSTGKTLGSGALGAAGSAAITFKPSPAGSYSIHAEYAGDATYATGNSTASSLTVTKNASTVGLSVPNKFKHGTKVTATITVKTVNGLVPTGKVTLKKGTKTLGSATLKNGKATIKFSIAKKGSYTLKAKYAGDGNFAAGTSPGRGVKVT